MEFLKDNNPLSMSSPSFPNTTLQDTISESNEKKGTKGSSNFDDIQIPPAPLGIPQLPQNRMQSNAILGMIPPPNGYHLNDKLDGHSGQKGIAATGQQNIAISPLDYTKKVGEDGASVSSPIPPSVPLPEVIDNSSSAGEPQLTPFTANVTSLMMKTPAVASTRPPVLPSRSSTIPSSTAPTTTAAPASITADLGSPTTAIISPPPPAAPIVLEHLLRRNKPEETTKDGSNDIDGKGSKGVVVGNKMYNHHPGKAAAAIPLQLPLGAPFSSFLKNDNLASSTMSYNLTRGGVSANNNGTTTTHTSSNEDHQMLQARQILHDSLASAPGGGFSSLASAPAALGELSSRLLFGNPDAVASRQQSETAMSVRTTYSGSKRKKKHLSKKEIMIRRQKHKKVEDRRRKRISNLFKRLAEACGCSGADKASILQNALNCIERGGISQQQQQKQQQQQQQQHNMKIVSQPQQKSSSEMKPIMTLTSNPFTSMHESVVMTKPLTLLDSKRMLLLGNLSFRKLFKVEGQGYLNVLSFMEGIDVLDLKKRVIQCQKGGMETFYQDVRVNVGGEIHIARMYTSMLMSRWHFITLWTITGRL